MPKRNIDQTENDIIEDDTKKPKNELVELHKITMIKLMLYQSVIFDIKTSVRYSVERYSGNIPNFKPLLYTFYHVSKECQKIVKEIISENVDSCESLGSYHMGFNSIMIKMNLCETLYISKVIRFPKYEMAKKLYDGLIPNYILSNVTNVVINDFNSLRDMGTYNYIYQRQSIYLIIESLKKLTEIIFHFNIESQSLLIDYASLLKNLEVTVNIYVDVPYNCIIPEILEEHISGIKAVSDIGSKKMPKVEHFMYGELISEYCNDWHQTLRLLPNLKCFESEFINIPIIIRKKYASHLLSVTGHIVKNLEHFVFLESYDAFTITCEEVEHLLSLKELGIQQITKTELRKIKNRFPDLKISQLDKKVNTFIPDLKSEKWYTEIPVSEQWNGPNIQKWLKKKHLDHYNKTS